MMEEHLEKTDPRAQKDPCRQTERREKRGVLTGGMILITLGILIFLHKLGVWAFSSSWPLLLVVIAAGTLIQRVRDLGGWIVGAVGLIFFLAENVGMEIWKIVNILLPILLILAGLRVLQKNIRKKDAPPEDELP